ncbi:MAG TPA: response regulator [Cyanobacteria bacterium UBA11369]|nr:response regulator [Cyanobacteria bacterium UBA11371]HBE36553.1 response regulator [Cyanobacteria bacterium UBA11368]HBE47771.1 response regulator [Cyanobacteria bacterium UBA11369]
MMLNDLANETLTAQLQAYSQRRFTGRLDIRGSITWSLYFCLGRLVWAAGGEHPVRRWHRLLKQYCPQIEPDKIRLREVNMPRTTWEYLALTVLVKRHNITGEQAVDTIKNTLTEVLFDILQHSEKERLIFIRDTQDILDASLTLINPGTALEAAQQSWEIWRNAGLGKLSPNIAPVVTQAEILHQMTSPGVYNNFVQLIDGKSTFRDLAVTVNQDSLVVTRALVPYIRRQIMGLMKIPDFPQLIAPIVQGEETSRILKPQATHIQTHSLKPRVSQTPHPQKIHHASSNTQAKLVRPLVACVEDSVQECSIMADILTKARYGFVSIPDSLQAVLLLLQYKPDFIFLDLVMPIANGYEICAQIRRVEYFKTTPIAILTGNDTIVDRVRAKMVGATDFVAKPIEARKVLSVLLKHLDLSSFSSDKFACLPDATV